MFLRMLGCWLVVASLCVAPSSSVASASFEALLQQAEAARSANPETFQQLLQRLDALQQQATPAQREQLHYLQIYATAYAGDYKSAIEAARKLIETSDTVDIKVRAGALIVNSCAITRQFTEGLRQLDRTLPLIDQVENTEVRQHALFAAAQLYSQIGQYRLGLKFAERLLLEPVSGRTGCFVGQLRLEMLQHLGELPADDPSIMQVVDQCMDQGEATVANFTRSTLAQNWAAQGQRDRAVALLQTNMSGIEATHYPRLISEIHALLAKWLLADGDIAGAEQHARAAIAQSTGITNSLPLVTAYETLYEIANERGETAQALRYYRRYAEVDKAYLNDVKAREMAYQVVRQETALKTQQNAQQIELLNQQNQVLQLRQQVSEQSAQNSRLLIALLAVLLLSIGYWAWRVKRGQHALRRLAQTDALTGVCNRQHFTRLAQDSLARCAQRGEPAALVMFDLDHFKNVNDSFGHVTGDWALKRVADTCKGFCRQTDHLGRLGGEEFAILLPGSDLQAATRLAEDCRVGIADIDTGESGHTFAISASFGVAATTLSGYDLATLMVRSDKMLYCAKREGRNRVCTDSRVSQTPQAMASELGSL